MRMRLLHLPVVLLVLSGCGPSKSGRSVQDATAPNPGAPVADEDAVVRAQDAERAADEAVPTSAETSLSELYPSLGDEEIAPSPELVEEKDDEEKYMAETAADGQVYLDPTKLAAAYDIPMEVTPLVEQYLTYFTTRGRKWYATWLSRSGRYLPMMKQIFRENGLPEDLTYLAMIESGFSNRAWSRTKASGPWQFMRATGSRYGLDDDWWIDERRDPELSTRAAAAHLRDLYDEFGDWYLAAAAYNAGSGKVNRAIRMYDTRNYWEICAAGRYFKPETKHYVPKLIAAAIIAKHPEQFGFKGIEYLEPLEYENVAVADATDLRVVAECAGADYDSVLELNPSLKRFCTPPGAESFEIRVPKGTSSKFAEAYAELDPKKRVTFRRHTVKRGDTISTIARKYGIDQTGVMRLNGITSARKLRVNTDLVIPVPSGNGVPATVVATDSQVPKPKGAGAASTTGSTTSQIAANAPAADSTYKPTRIGPPRTTYESKGRPEDREEYDRRPVAPPKNREKARVTLAAGDTLWSLSQKYGVSVNEIKRWNSIRNHRSVQAGATLTIYVPKDKLASANANSPSTGAAVAEPAPTSSIKGPKVTYRVKKGDTVWDIARQHNVDPQDLLKDNNLSRRSKIKPGDVLEIRLAAAAAPN